MVPLWCHYAVDLAVSQLRWGAAGPELPGAVGARGTAAAAISASKLQAAQRSSANPGPLTLPSPPPLLPAFHPLSSCPQVHLGRLLQALGSADPAAARAELAAARREVMGPFSAAAMESYARAYPHLGRLHMLQEAADVAGGWVAGG